MIAFRSHVNPRDVHPCVWLAIGIAYDIRCSLPRVPSVLWVTSLNDGDHGENSLHYIRNSPDRKFCRAADLRTFDLTVLLRSLWVSRCQAALNDMGFDIVLHPGQRNPIPGDDTPEHLHIEWQPKVAAEHIWYPEAQLVAV